MMDSTKLKALYERTNGLAIHLTDGSDIAELRELIPIVISQLEQTRIKNKILSDEVEYTRKLREQYKEVYAPVERMMAAESEAALARAENKKLIEQLHMKDIREENLTTYYAAARRDLSRYGRCCETCRPDASLEYPCARCEHDADNWHHDEDNWRWRGEDEFLNVPEVASDE